MSGPPKMDRAQRHRVAFTGRLEPLDQQAEGPMSIDVDIIDLSTGGAGIRCKTIMNTGSVWRLNVDPDLCDDLSETVVVRRCVQDEAGYHCGVQFVSAAALFTEAGIGMDKAIQDLATNRARAIHAGASDMAAPIAARLRFEEDVVVAHMENIQLTSSHRLTVNNDMVDCDAQLEGALEVVGEITGGCIKTTDTIKVATLGKVGSQTTVVLGNFPKTNALVVRVSKQLDVFDEQIKDKSKELAYIGNHGNEIGHTVRERVMELEYELEEIREKRSLLQSKFDALLNHYLENTEIGLRVERAIEPGVVIEFLNQRYEVNHSVEGPLEISCAKDHTLMISLPDQSECPLAESLRTPAL